LENVHEAFITSKSGIEGESISENGKDKGVEDFAPVGIIEAPYRVPENAEGADG